MHILAWTIPLIAPIFLKKSLVFPILLFSSIVLQCSFKKAFLLLLAVLCKCAFSWVSLSLSPLLLLLFPHLFVRPPLTTIVGSCISFSLEWFWSLPPVQCYEPPSIVLLALRLPDLTPWIYSSPSLDNHKGFYLVTPEWPSGFPYFLQFKSEFCNKVFMIWATAGSRSCFFADCIVLLHLWLKRT